MNRVALQFVISIALSLLFTVGSASAATRTWDGGGGADTNWTTCLNWSSNLCPGLADVATFNSTSVNNAILNATTSVLGVDINAGYTGTISMSSGVTLNVGTSNFDIAAGTFTGSSDGTLDTASDIIISGGTFNAPGNTNVRDDWTHTAGGAFNHQGHTVTFDENVVGTLNFSSVLSTSGFFYNVLVNKTSGIVLQVASGDTFVIEGSLTLRDGSLTGGSSSSSVEARENVTIESTLDSSTLLLSFKGGGDQGFDLTGGEGTYNGDLTVNKSAGTLTLLSDLTMNANGQDFTMTAGTFNANGKAVLVDEQFLQGGGTYMGGSGSLDIDNDFTLSGGTFNAPSYLYVYDDFTHIVGGTFNHSNGTIVFDSSVDDTLNFSNIPTSGLFYSVTMNKANNAQLRVNTSDTLITEGTLNLVNGRFNAVTSSGSIVDARGDVTVAGTVDGTLTRLNFSGEGIQAFTLTGAEALYDSDIFINKSGGEVILFSALTLNAASQDLMVQEGLLDLNGFNLTVNGSLGTFVVEDGGELELQGGEAITLNASNPRLQSGSLVTYYGPAGPYVLNDYTYHHLTIKGTGAIFTMNVNEDLGGDLNIMAGTLDVNDKSLSIHGDTSLSGGTLKSGTNTVTFGDSDDDSVMILSGIFEIESDAPDTDIVKIAGTWTNLGGTILYKAGMSISADLIAGLAPYENLTIDSFGSSYSLPGDTDVNQNLTITAGALDAGEANHTITVGGGWSNSGTFVPRTGTVVFDTISLTSTFAGNTTFNKLTVITAGETLVFTAGTTQTVLSTLTLTGASESLITLRSSLIDNAWNLVATGGVDISYVDVKDSNASGGSTVAQSNSIDSGGNINWIFNRAPTVLSVMASQSSTGTGDVTLDFTLADPDGDTSLRSKVEYSLDGGNTWSDPTLSGANVDNSALYQIGPSGAGILRAVWQSSMDLDPSTDLSTAQIRITPYDDRVEGAPNSSANFILDRVAPSGLANFNYIDFSSGHAVINWTPSTDTNFNHYEIWYDSQQSDVQNRSGAAQEWDGDNDSALALASTGQSTLLIDPRNLFFKIFAVDNYGNESTVADLYIGGGQSSGSSGTSVAPVVEEVEEAEEIAEEEVVEEVEEEIEMEVEEAEEIAEEDLGWWNGLQIAIPEHWSIGYVKNLEDRRDILERATDELSLLKIVTSFFSGPDVPMNRGESLEFLLALASYPFEATSYIQFAYGEGLVQGYPDGTFHADQAINRVEALKMCFYFFEGPWPDPLYGNELLTFYSLSENPFDDVDLNEWYAPYLIHAYSKGAVHGYGDGTFGPANPVTYAEFLKIATLMQNIDQAVDLAEQLE